MFLGSASALGDTITFIDRTDVGGPIDIATSAPGRTIIIQFPQGVLEVNLLAPSPLAHFVSDFCPLQSCDHLNIGEYGTATDPERLSDVESDIFEGHSFQPGVYEMDWSIQTVFPCSGESDCFVREDGLLYTLDKITWSDGTVDTINFQAIPEPSSLVLVSTCLLGLVGIFRRKLFS
jgi:hypothetical protein